MAPWLLLGFGRAAWSLVKVSSVVYVVGKYLVPIEVAVARGDSMEPAISDGDVLFCERQSVRRKGVQTGDIVLFNSPDEPDKCVCKRVKTVAYSNKVFVPVASRSKETEVYQIGVPRGSVYLEGDNATSKKYEPIPYGLLRSRVILRVWPLNDIKYFSRAE